jgi:hypothetical protein
MIDCLVLPLAQRDAWESLGNRFSGEHAKLNLSDLWSLGGVLIAAVALIFLLRWVYHRQQARRFSCEPRHLFDDLCRTHRLRRGERKRLRMLAEHHDLASQAILFVRPDLFDAPQLPDDQPATLVECERLQRKLFAGLEGSHDRHCPSPAVAETSQRSAIVPTVEVACEPSAASTVQ